MYELLKFFNSYKFKIKYEKDEIKIPIGKNLNIIERLER